MPTSRHPSSNPRPQSAVVAGLQTDASAPRRRAGARRIGFSLCSWVCSAGFHASSWVLLSFPFLCAPLRVREGWLLGWVPHPLPSKGAGFSRGSIPGCPTPRRCVWALGLSKHNAHQPKLSAVRSKPVCQNESHKCRRGHLGRTQRVGASAPTFRLKRTGL